MLCLVVERKLDRHPLQEAVEAAARSGIDWLQLRERELSSAAWLTWARSLVAVAQDAEPRLRVVVNRRVDIALTLGIDAVHLGFDACPPRVARSLIGRSGVVGCSTHSPTEVAAAAESGADYAQLAPILDPLSKPSERPALGVEALAQATRHGIPVIAQGGISPEHCADVLAAGAAGIAVTGAILLADDPAAATERLRHALDEAATSK